MTRYFHAGDRGDLIYALPAVRAHAGDHGAELILHPWCFDNAGPPPSVKPLDLFHSLRRLLERQPYIAKVSVGDFSADGVNLNLFRANEDLATTNIAAIYCDLLGVDRKVIDQPWLFNIEPTPTCFDAWPKSKYLRAADTWQTQGVLTARMMGACLGLRGRQSPPPGHFVLNPRLVEWMMGYPDRWTELPPSATPSSRNSPPRSSAGSS